MRIKEKFTGIFDINRHKDAAEDTMSLFETQNTGTRIMQRALAFFYTTHRPCVLHSVLMHREMCWVSSPAITSQLRLTAGG